MPYNIIYAYIVDGLGHLELLRSFLGGLVIGSGEVRFLSAALLTSALCAVATTYSALHLNHNVSSSTRVGASLTRYHEQRGLTFRHYETGLSGTYTGSKSLH
jgi:hypothetical protein